MQEAVPVGVGAMYAILGLDGAGRARRVAPQAAAETGEAVEAVNFNDPKQTVIAGSKAGADKACEMLKAAGAKRALLLPVSAPFHSSLMKPAAERLKAEAGQRGASRGGLPGRQQHRRGCHRQPTPRCATRCTARPSARCAGSRSCRR